jgi:hypothetical protein
MPFPSRFVSFARSECVGLDRRDATTGQRHHLAR